MIFHGNWQIIIVLTKVIEKILQTVVIAVSEGIWNGENQVW